jgi:hypothetical protein
MKKYALLLPVLVLSMFSCKEAGDNTLNMKTMEELLYKNYPSVNRVSVEVEENSNVYITLGDVHLYSLSADEKQKIVNDLGPEIIRIFDKGNWLNKGRITFAKQESTLQYTDSVVYTINLDSLKKAKK